MAACVPTIAQVRPGAAVSIVLKQDQGSGRQVQGHVADLLTRGNHPRGIKVRLQDGRIGRVQSMVGGASVSAPDATTLQQDLQDQTTARQGGARKPYRSERLGMRYTDVRLDQVGEEPPAEMDLMAFVKPAKVKGKKMRKSGDDGEQAFLEEATPRQSAVASMATARCPVCDSFDGDEAAVAHHVESHFT